MSTLHGEKINSLSQFAKLADADIQEAYHVFIEPEFRNVFRGRDRKYLSLYEGMSKLPVSYQDLEEFLIGAKQKQEVLLSLSDTSKSFLNFTNSSKDVIQIIKNQWGFVKIDVDVQGDFIEIEKKLIITDDFIGSSYNFEYIIKQERLHGGRNFGRIRFITCHQELNLEIVVEKERKVQRSKKYFNLRKLILEFMGYYMSFRMKRLTLTEWVEKTDEVLTKLTKVGDLYRYYGLFKAQLLFANGEPETAYDVLKEFKDNKRLLYTPELKAYFLYLTTLYENEKPHIQNMNDKIYNLYLQNQESWQILWMRLNIDEELNRNLSKRMEVIEYQYKLGCRSRIMYLEAFDVMLREPSRLKKLSEFETAVLWWAAKENLLDKNIIPQIAEIAGRVKNFDLGIFKLLTKCYEKCPEKEVLTAICSLLIKGNMTDKKYFIWYELAVNEGLRLTKLYEYYMDTMEYGHYELLPQMVRMYYTYNNTLNYKRRAALYANIIKNKEVDEDTYLNYQEAMEQFMMEQLAAGNISRDLAIIYGQFIENPICPEI